ncbi:hypothetical protein [Acinetobacter baumannii]|uniref:hypothetical protein n=1 Tax=Acinetobacter baumannii TaxID=470 RepID=UPI001EFBEC53|nr:hypothetical protein [Acinetobacter baumannii]
MDKCREEFEVIARSNGWNLTTYPEITERIDYVNNLTEQAWQMYQHQQAKVEELQTLYTQQGINMLKMQKRVDAAQKLIDDWNCGGVHIFDLLDELEQALKGEG